ncbi:MAG: helix-turn-helix transcriptional regulator [bacterium]|nr:helix-turn-helix transcriptional regulator [bacterium]
MDIRRVIGLNITKYRKANGLSQEELGFEAGLHRTYISGVERGIRNPTVTVLKKIAEALKISPAKLFDEVKSRKS